MLASPRLPSSRRLRQLIRQKRRAPPVAFSATQLDFFFAGHGCGAGYKVLVLRSNVWMVHGETRRTASALHILTSSNYIIIITMAQRQLSHAAICRVPIFLEMVSPSTRRWTPVSRLLAGPSEESRNRGPAAETGEFSSHPRNRPRPAPAPRHVRQALAEQPDDAISAAITVIYFLIDIIKKRATSPRPDFPPTLPRLRTIPCRV